MNRGQSPPAAPSPGARQALGGLLVRKEGWTLTGKARIIVLLAVVGSAWAATVFIYPFLAFTDQTHSEILIVEGWIPKDALTGTLSLCRRGGYQRVFTSGCLAPDTLDGLPNQNYADFAARRLMRMGMTNDIQPVPGGDPQMDRTYNSALAVKQWMQQHAQFPASLDVVTVGAHARRSRLLFEKAFGDDVKIGIIAMPPSEYDAAHWWRSSEGVRDVIGEAIAYVYARLLFRPGM
jgi:hypothetical protein